MASPSPYSDGAQRWSQSPPTSTVGPAPQSINDKARRLSKAIRELRSLSIDPHWPDSPEIVAIGDPNANTVHIIEAMLDIVLPSNVRCPIAIRTSPGRIWACDVSLHEKFSYDPHPFTEQRQPIRDWTPKGLTTGSPFAAVQENSELEHMVRRAELALLSPNQSPQRFLARPINGDVDYVPELPFSPNTISLSIVAPRFMEMSFSILPELFVPFQGQEEGERFEAFAKSYIERDTTLVLLACAANRDLEKSSALRLVLESRVDSRCIGVLDTAETGNLPPESVQKLNDVLSMDKARELRGSWYLTTHSHAEEAGEHTAYHDMSYVNAAPSPGPVSCSTPLSAHIRGCGVLAIQQALVRKWFERVMDHVPHIVAAIQRRIRSVDDQMKALAQEAAASKLSSTTDIDIVKRAIIQQIGANSVNSQMRGAYRDIFVELGDQLKAMLPQPDVRTPGLQPASVNLAQHTAGSDDRLKRKRHFLNSTISAESRQPDVEGGTNEADQRHLGQPSNCLPRNNSGGVIFRLGDVKYLMHSSSSADLDPSNSSSITKDLILQSVEEWETVVNGAVEKVQELFLRVLDETISAKLSYRESTALFEAVKSATYELFWDLFATVKANVHDLVVAETIRPITYSDVIKPKISDYKKRLRGLREKVRVAESAGNTAAMTSEVVRSTQGKGKARDGARATPDLGSDEYQDEVEALATPMAYYETAAAGLVDIIAKQFEYHLMYTFETRLSGKLAVITQAIYQDDEECFLVRSETTEVIQERSALKCVLDELSVLLAASVGVSPSDPSESNRGGNCVV